MSNWDAKVFPVVTMFTWICGFWILQRRVMPSCSGRFYFIIKCNSDQKCTCYRKPVNEWVQFFHLHMRRNVIRSRTLFQHGSAETANWPVVSLVILVCALLLWNALMKAKYLLNVQNISPIYSYCWNKRAIKLNYVESWRKMTSSRAFRYIQTSRSYMNSAGKPHVDVSYVYPFLSFCFLCLSVIIKTCDILY